MTTIKDIYTGAERLLNQILRKEIQDQGHHLTGNLEDSLTSKIKIKKNDALMEGNAAHYAAYVNDGFPAASASWKQFPFLIEYFKKRGLPDNEAKNAAAATIMKWMKEGMPTQASKAYSKTGNRKDMIEQAFFGSEHQIDEYFGNSFDFAIEESFQKEKSETV